MYDHDHTETLQRNTFRYFWKETNPENGRIPDNTADGGVPASIAGVGMALASYPVEATSGRRAWKCELSTIERVVG